MSLGNSRDSAKDLRLFSRRLQKGKEGAGWQGFSSTAGRKYQ